jgi:plasmid replication initiation protein
LMQWKTTSKTPVFELNQFREQLGVGANEYKLMNDFKKRVLDLATSQINEHTDITASYEQHKRGRTIIGFSFKFKEKKQVIEHKASIKSNSLNPLKGVTDLDAFYKKHRLGVESMDETFKRLRKEAAEGTFSMTLTD